MSTSPGQPPWQVALSRGLDATRATRLAISMRPGVWSRCRFFAVLNAVEVTAERNGQDHAVRGADIIRVHPFDGDYP